MVLLLKKFGSSIKCFPFSIFVTFFVLVFFPSTILISLAFLSLLFFVEKKQGLFWVVKFFCITHLSLVVVGLLSEHVGEDTFDGETFFREYHFVQASILALFIIYSFKSSPRAMRRIHFSVIMFSIIFLLYSPPVYAMQFTYAIGLGFLFGIILNRRSPVLFPYFHSYISVTEKRLLLALLVAIFSVGSALMNLMYVDNTGYNVVGALFFGAQGEEAYLCQYRHIFECSVIHFSLAFREMVVIAIPVLFSLLGAEGIRRGRRAGFIFTISLCVIALLFILFYAIMFITFYSADMSQDYNIRRLIVSLIIPVVTSALIVIVSLWKNRKLFSISTSIKAYIYSAKNIFILLGISIISYFIVYGIFERNNFMRFLDGLAKQYFFYLYSLEDSQPYFPDNFIALIIFLLSGPIFLLLIVFAVFFSFFKYSKPLYLNEDRKKARRILHYGGSSMSWMVLWTRNEYWFSEKYNTAIAYQLHDHIALSLGGPFGDPAGYKEALADFIKFCDLKALIPCFYSVNSEALSSYEGFGLQKLQIAEESIVNIKDLQFSGKKWQNVRTALNKAKSLDVAPVFFKYSEASPEIKQKIYEISEIWISNKDLPEMCFTLGGLHEIQDEEVLCLAAVGSDGLVHGITSWLPVFSNGIVISWTLDFMRRHDKAFSGVVDFMIANFILEMQKKDISCISLSGSPLSITLEEDEEQESVALLLSKISIILEPVYGFKTLAFYKKKFMPEVRPLYMLYKDKMQLPNISRALVRAYLPDLSLFQISRFMYKIVSSKKSQNINKK